MRVWRSLAAALLMAATTAVAVVAAPQAAMAAPTFKAPFPCGQRWTYSHHSAEVRLAQGDWVNAEGYSNNWWSKLATPSGFITNIYVDHPSAQLPGVPNC